MVRDNMLAWVCKELYPKVINPPDCDYFTLAKAPKNLHPVHFFENELVNLRNLYPLSRNPKPKSRKNGLLFYNDTICCMKIHLSWKRKHVVKMTYQNKV